jgi:GNAT superfamily N-acetyltransferase
MTPEIELVTAPDPAQRAPIVRPLVAFNAAHAGPNDYRTLAVLLRDPATRESVGGLWGGTAWRWLYIELLFVPETLRGAGLGTQLIELAEAEALRRGCHHAWVDTYSFQARGFYERLRYAVFGTLEDYPPGHRRYFLQKRLTPAGGADE